MNTRIVAKRLFYENDWEVDKYFVDNCQISELYTVMINGRDYPVRSKNVSVNYNACGHTYTATSKHYFVTENVFGVQMEFDLNKIIKKTKVFAIGYK